jgi:AraC-like DNA-binding protein
MTDKRLSITKFRNVGKTKIKVKAAHRDDHFVFIFQERGNSRILVDFKEIVIKGCSVLCILPGQVHYGISAHDAISWLIAMDTSLVSTTFRSILEGSALNQEALSVSAKEADGFKKCISLLSAMSKRSEEENFIRQIIDSQSNAFIGMLALIYSRREQVTGEPNVRAVIITREFKKLVCNNFRNMKSPAAYAGELNISAPYLNEAVKRLTGFPAGYWIQQEMLTEAKRMLYYTDSSVKEIAYALGFKDHTYFSRLFSKAEGMPPLAFRLEYRK